MADGWQGVSEREGASCQAKSEDPGVTLRIHTVDGEGDSVL